MRLRLSCRGYRWERRFSSMICICPKPPFTFSLDFFFTFFTFIFTGGDFDCLFEAPFGNWGSHLHLSKTTFHFFFFLTFSLSLEETLTFLSRLPMGTEVPIYICPKLPFTLTFSLVFFFTFDFLFHWRRLRLSYQGSRWELRFSSTSLQNNLSLSLFLLLNFFHLFSSSPFHFLFHWRRLRLSCQGSLSLFHLFSSSLFHLFSSSLFHFGFHWRRLRLSSSHLPLPS